MNNGKNINVYRMIRIIRDKSVKEVAKELLVTPAYINAIEKGDREPSERLIRDYARVLEVDAKTINDFKMRQNQEQTFERIMLYMLKVICNDETV